MATFQIVRNLLSLPRVFVQQTASYDKIRRSKYPLTRFRRTVVKPEKYTTNPIDVQRLGGRDPKTGRVVAKTVGGGLKYKFLWVDFRRVGPTTGAPLVEKVHSIKPDRMNRTGHIALVASGDKKRWILATESMKEGDLIKTSSEIPRIAVRPTEGDAHPLGALPLGTVVNSIEKYPGRGGQLVRAAGSCAQVLRKIDGNVVVQLPSKRLISVSEKCTAVVGRVSNPLHGSTPIGSAQANRWLGNRPRSGLWHRKDGYCGRKINRVPQMRVYSEPPKSKIPDFQLTI